ncbi:hypothetical protein CSOJ01_13108 [Colletotrichum sojae]|uniref:Uncharacterized protein n=1 Tax=Colletotrichum sojae TaxID=2175907 RepID=A0A8H6MKR4_9PEZI|nr:hypothetical protein CSOJ01_13108 [Colletotrichum sojae]
MANTHANEDDSDGNNFLSLGNNTFLYEPSPSDTPRAANDGPGLVVLCTWLGGSTTRRVGKYVSGYRALFPHAKILLIRTVFADISLRSFASIRARLSPARDVIIESLQNGAEMLLHVFSHGGCNTAIQLADAVTEKARGLMGEGLRVVLFDCCPGDGSFANAYEAASLSLPESMSTPVRVVGRMAAYVGVAGITALQKSGMMASIEEMRRRLNEENVFGRRVRRLYLFSRGDRVVPERCVREHMREGKEAGAILGEYTRVLGWGRDGEDWRVVEALSVVVVLKRCGFGDVNWCELDPSTTRRGNKNESEDKNEGQ